MLLAWSLCILVQLPAALRYALFWTPTYPPAFDDSALRINWFPILRCLNDARLDKALEVARFKLPCDVMRSFSVPSISTCRTLPLSWLPESISSNKESQRIRKNT